MRCFALLLAAFSLTLAFAADEASLAAARELRVLVPQVVVTMDERLGVAKHIASPAGFLTGPAGVGKAVAKAAAAGPDQTVRSFLNAWPSLLGGDATILNDAEIVRDDVTAHSGLHTKVWRQQFNGIPVYNGLLITSTTKRDELIAIGSAFAAAPDRSVQGIARRAALIAQPNLTAEAAVSAILRHLKAPAQDAVTTQNDGGTIQKQILHSAGAKGSVDAQLTWFPLSKDNLRLAWHVVLVERVSDVMYGMVVDAQTSEILTKSRLTSQGFYNPDRVKRAAVAPVPAAAPAAAVAPVKAAPAEAVRNNDGVAPSVKPSAVKSSAVSKAATPLTFRVYTNDSPRPLSPGVSITPPPEVPRLFVSPDLTTAAAVLASPSGWIDSNNETRGNNVDAHLDLNDDDVADVPRPMGVGTSPVMFNFGLDLRLAPSTYGPAAVTNLFYWCNVVHDRLYGLGFTETAGNFQKDNFGKGGFGNDEVQADAQDGGGTDNANFSTPPEGRTEKPRMQMYIFVGTNPDRDGDLENSIIIHEYVHGLSHRLVAGGKEGNLEAVQCGGMGEGWSDFYALSMLSEPTDDPWGSYIMGSYVLNDYTTGIRRYPYAVEPGPFVSVASINPLTFSDIILNDEVHDEGEVWCQALWECRGELIAKYGATAGNELMLRLVTDGMKLTPFKPSFTDARNAILQADLTANAGANAAELWRAFAKRGLGFGAVSGPSDTTANVVESYEFTLGLQVSDADGFNAFGRSGGTFSSTAKEFTLTNAGATPINWTAGTNRTWIAASPASGTLAARATTKVTVTLTAAANALANGSWNDSLSLVDTTNTRVIIRPLHLRVTDNYTITSAAYSWVDPSAHTVLTLGDDTISPAQILPFTFPFYEANRTSIVVAANGLIGFGATTGLVGNKRLRDYSAGKNRTLPFRAVAPHDMLAVWWDDLNPAAVTADVGSVRYGVDGTAPNRRVIITWDHIPRYDPFRGLFGNTFDFYVFQAILDEATNDIICQYQDVRPLAVAYDDYGEPFDVGAGRSATIGTENEVGDAAALYSFNGSTLLTNGLALRFHYGPSVPGTPLPTNAAPTVATAAAANPSPVTGISTTLTVMGADADGGGEPNLTYTWSLNGNLSTVFTASINGSNAAKTTIATFTQTGTYPIMVTITDRGGKSVTSTVNVTVVATPTSIAVTPATLSMANGTSFDFNVVGLDQFGFPTTTVLTATWTMEPPPGGGLIIGSIDSAGIYTANGQGIARILATSGVLTATADITISNGKPTVLTAATATPNPVTGLITNVSAVGADDLGEPALTYTWSTVGSVPAPVTFSPNGTNVAKSSTATFTKAGTYSLRVTISDASIASVTSDVTVTVVQTPTGTALRINPASTSVVVNASQSFAAFSVDQFGDVIIGTPRTVTWSTNLGSITTAGVFTAPAAVGTATIQAVDGVDTATATVTIAQSFGTVPDGNVGGAGSGSGCGMGAASAFLGLLFLLTWRRRRLGE